MNAKTPTTPGELYDFLQARYGIGSYDDLSSDVPYYQARALEISKLKAMLKKRRCTVDDIVQASWYADRERKPIWAAWQLFLLVVDANKAWRAEQRAQQETPVQQLARAAAEAADRGDDTWAARLMNTHPTEAEAALADWAAFCREH